MLKINWLQKIKDLFTNKAIVLMYHRIANVTYDPWQIAVTPERFERQLLVLKKWGTVISLPELVAAINDRSVCKKSIVITFDDGYSDNYLSAKPLLEKYHLPATFFITSRDLDTNNNFWWDELEHLILWPEQLPRTFASEVNGVWIRLDLGVEQQMDGDLVLKQQAWKACTEPPPTRRSELFLKIWQQLQPLPYDLQQEQLGKIRKWAGIPRSNSVGSSSIMTLTQLQELAENSLFSIGAHTVTHLRLDQHPLHLQKQELADNRKFLSGVIKRNVQLLAYPYGNYNEDTLSVLADLGYTAALNTEEHPVTNGTETYHIPRFQVENWEEKEFERRLHSWLNL